MKQLIHSITFMFLWGISTQLAYAQVPSYPTDEEFQKLIPDFQNKVVYRSQFKPNPSSASLIVSQSDKQNVNSEYSAQEAANRLIKKANDFRYSLSRGEKLESYMSNSWSFIYHEDNRCDGSTDGSLSGLSPRQVDQALRIQLTNDGNGWGCDPREPTSFEANFSLHNKVANWDRFEITKYEIINNLIYIEGAGISDYLKVYFDEFNGELLIVTIEYSSEDPG